MLPATPRHVRDGAHKSQAVREVHKEIIIFTGKFYCLHRKSGLYYFLHHQSQNAPTWLRAADYTGLFCLHSRSLFLLQ
jgi:predicted membrane channel-forming protein YqfA (hemolysin III family)